MTFFVVGRCGYVCMLFLLLFLLLVFVAIAMLFLLSLMVKRLTVKRRTMRMERIEIIYRDDGIDRFVVVVSLSLFCGWLII
jgi:hypothetical protein